MLAATQVWSYSAESKLRGIHQELIDCITRENSKLNAAEYDFTDTIACRVPEQVEYLRELGVLKKLECTSIHSSSVKGDAVITFGSIDCNTSINATNINPEVETVFFKRGDILDVQISINEERSSVSSGQLSGRTGQALIGTVLFGATGGQIGASGKRNISMTSKERVLISSLALEVFTRDAVHPYLFIHFFPNMRPAGDGANPNKGNDAVPASMITDRKEYKQLKRWYSILIALKIPSASAQPAQQGSSPDIADQLSRLYDLKEKGIISQEEFRAAKRKILGS